MSSIENGGVYAIRHIESGKVYVGSTANFHNRWRQHRRELNLGSHHSRHLQNAWNKYGPEAFVFEVLQTVEDDRGLIKAEQEHIDRLDSWRSEQGYNVCKTAGSCRGVKRSDEVKARISAANRGQKRTAEQRVVLVQAQLNRPVKASMDRRIGDRDGRHDRCSPSIDELTGLGRKAERDGAIVALHLGCGWPVCRIAALFRMTDRHVLRVVADFKAEHEGWRWWVGPRANPSDTPVPGPKLAIG